MVFDKLQNPGQTISDSSQGKFVGKGNATVTHISVLMLNTAESKTAVEHGLLSRFLILVNDDDDAPMTGCLFMVYTRALQCMHHF